MSGTPKALSKPKLLIGEGKDEVMFFEAYLKHLKIEDIQVELYNGKTSLKTYLKTLKLRPGYINLESLGITRDADDSATNAFQSVSNSLKNTKFSYPRKIGEIVGDNPKVSIFILPNQKNRGMLEDLCLASLDADPILNCVEDYFKCILKQSNKKHKKKDLAKAKIHAWLASQDEPDKRLGEATKSGYLSWDNFAFNDLKQFILAI